MLIEKDVEPNVPLVVFNENDDTRGIVSNVTVPLPEPLFVVYVPADVNPLLYENEIVVDRLPFALCDTVHVF